MWLAPSTCSVSSEPLLLPTCATWGGTWGPHFDSLGPQTRLVCRGAAVGREDGGEALGHELSGSCSLSSPSRLLLNLGADIGHVDFLEKVHRLADRPYIIAGLHFDQVTALLLPGPLSS